MAPFHSSSRRRIRTSNLSIEDRAPVFRIAIAKAVADALDALTVEQVYQGVDYGKKSEDFTVALPRFRLPGKVDELAKKVIDKVCIPSAVRFAIALQEMSSFSFNCKSVHPILGFGLADGGRPSVEYPFVERPWQASAHVRHQRRMSVYSLLHLFHILSRSRGSRHSKPALSMLGGPSRC